MIDEEERKLRLAYAIREARLRRKMSPPELAKAIHTTRGTVNKWESGENVPSLLWLGPLCSALQVDARLFAELPPVPASPVSDYLVAEATQEGLDEGRRRARPPQGGATPSEPQPLRPRPAPEGERG